MGKKPVELQVVCVECGFPVISTEYYQRGPKKGRVKKQVLASHHPETEEEALENGWVDTGCGFLCPECGARHLQEEEIAAQQQEGGGAGTGALATFLAQEIAKQQGEEFEGAITDDEIPLPKPHVLTGDATSVSYAEDGDLVGWVGTLTCTACKKTWSVTGGKVSDADAVEVAGHCGGINNEPGTEKAD